MPRGGASFVTFFVQVRPPALLPHNRTTHSLSAHTTAGAAQQRAPQQTPDSARRAPRRQPNPPPPPPRPSPLRVISTSQVQLPHVFFTLLEEFNLYQGRAQPHMVLTHYTARGAGGGGNPLRFCSPTPVRTALALRQRRLRRVLCG